MWLSKRREAEIKEEPSVQMGSMSLIGTSLGVYLAAERRNVALVAPGGYHWKPASNDAVLVLSAGEEACPCIVGMEQGAGGASLAPGEVWISVDGKSGIYLQNNGRVNLLGEIYVNGKALVIPTPPAGGGGA